MGSEDLPLYNSSQGQIVEKFSQHFPDVVVLVLPHALIVEAIVLSDASGFVVSSQDGEPFLVPDFEGQEEADCFSGVVSPVDIVSQEEVVGVGDVSSDFEQLHKIVELTVNVSADKDGCSDVDHIRLLGEDFPG